MDVKDLDDARMRYHFALAPEDYDRLPFYSALLQRLEEDSLALELLASVRVEQRNPMLILAILQFAALRGHEVLGPIYDDARHGQLGEPDDAARRVLDVIHETPALVRDELWRSTQTNEPGRSAVLQAVIGDLVVGATTTINVIEVGTSAGINLCFDQFPVRAHDDGNPLTLLCEDLTPIDRARAMPKVASRVGIDPHPLDLTSEEDRCWLKSCLWPEERRRHERFDAIVKARPSWPAATVLTGRALERLDDAFALCDPDNLTIVFNTWVAFYFTPEERVDYFSELQRWCASHNVAWISIESTLVKLPGIDVNEEARHRGASQIVLTRPGSTPTRWGWCHAHGRWLERSTS
ncbi:MAG TPA: DUF2332 domain-containing protein [Acidimicrobiales bacterium]